MTSAGMLATGRSGLDPQLIPDAAHDQPRSLPVFIELAPIFSRALSLTNHEGLGTVVGDIRDRALLDGLIAATDVVFHQAAVRITQCAEDPRLALEVLADGTFEVVEAAVAAGVSKVVAASSASVYGLAEEFPTGEPPPVRQRHDTARRSRSMKACCAAFGPPRASTTWRSATSTCTGRAWTSTARTPKCSFAGWSGSTPACRR